MHVGGVGLVGFFVVVYQAASGCSSCDSKSLISCNVSGGRLFVVGFGVVVVACVVLWVVGGGWVTLIVARMANDRKYKFDNNKIRLQ